MCYLESLLTLGLLVGLVVFLETVQPENIQEAVYQLIILGQAFLAGDVDTGQRIECLDFNELIPE